MPFPPQRRVITYHLPATSTSEPPVAVHTSDLTPTPPAPETLGEEIRVAGLWSSSSEPGNGYGLDVKEGETEGKETRGLNVVGGTNFQVTEMDPNIYVGMHRTSSIDYNVITHGSAYLITPCLSLSSSPTPFTPSSSQYPKDLETFGPHFEYTLCKVGDVVVQRGTLHAWQAGEEGVRWVCVLVDAKAVEVDGKGMKEVSF